MNANYLIEIGPNLLAQLETVAPGESVPAQILEALEARKFLLEENARLRQACQELRSYVDLKLQGHRQDYPEDHCMVQTALRMLALVDGALARQAIESGGGK